MQCKVDGCCREATYKADQVCQKHYFRMMRNGTYDLKPKMPFIFTPNGYVKRYAPSHPLAVSDSYVFEHRSVMWDAVGPDCGQCQMCGKPESWETCHVDHIDNDRQNNDRANLRILCRGCNVMRGHTAMSIGKWFLTIDGVCMSANAWSRQPGVMVTSATIIRRKNLGMSDRECVYGRKVTHVSVRPKKAIAKHDKTRGVPRVGDISRVGVAEGRPTVSDRDLEAAERDTVLPADMASRRAG